MSANPNLVRPDRDTLVQWLAELSDNQLAKRLGCTSPTIARWRDHYGLPRSRAKSAGNIKWRTNRDYFTQIDTPAKAYILGLLIADGHIRKEGYKAEISVREADVAILEAIAAELECDAPLGWMTNHYDGSRMRRLYLCGQQIVHDLNAHGVRHDKSYTATYPAVEPELESHLVRGIWDGDGSILRYEFNLIGTPALLDGVVTAVQRHTGCSLRYRRGGEGKRYLYAYGTRRDTPVLHWMYSGAEIGLERKREAYERYWCLRSRVHSL